MGSIQLASGHTPGAAPLLVFLHGLGCAGSQDWPPVAQAEALAGRASLWVDLAGFGRSERPQDFSYDLVDQALLLEPLISSYAMPVALVGHSMGGTLAVILAERMIRAGAPPLAVVLAEPNLRAADATGSARAAGTAVKAFVDGWRGWLEEIDSKGYLASARLADPLAFHRSACSLVAHGRQMLPRFLALPVARKGYILGMHSSKATHETARQVESGGVEVVRVERSGHNFSADAPAGFARALAGLLGG